MFTVSLSTLISIVIVFLFIIFLLLISKTKPSKNQTKEMQEVGWEIVNQIQEYTLKLEEEKVQIQQALTEMKEVEKRITQAAAKAPSKQGDEVDWSHPIPIKKNHKNMQILELNEKGHTAEDIAKLLQVPKGIVEVTLNLQTTKKNA